MTKNFNLKEKLKLSSEAKMVLTEILVFVLGFVLMSTKFIFGIYPFGLAYLCSLRKYTLFGFFGCLLSLIFLLNGDIVYLIALIGTLALRIASSLIHKNDKHIIYLGEKVKNAAFDNIFCENIEVRVSISVISAFGIGLYRVISTSYSYYEIFVLVFFSILAGILTYALSVGGDRSLLSYGVIVFALIYRLGDFTIFSLDVSIILSYFVVLYLSRYLGSVKSGAYGLILGLCVSPSLAPIFSIFGLVSGLLWNTSYYLAILCGAVLSVGYSVFVGGYTSLITVTPSVIFVSLLIYPLLKFKMLPVPNFVKNATQVSKPIEAVMLEKADIKDRKALLSLSNALKEISLIINKSSQKEKSPSRVNLHSLCVTECEAFCYNCPKHFICWQNDIGETEENLNRLSKDLFVGGSVSKNTVTEKFLHRCPHIEKIIESINNSTREKLENSVKNNKLEASSKDFERISHILSGVIESQENERYVDKHLSERLRYHLAKIGLIFEDALVTGKSSKEIIITGVNIERSKCSREQLKREIENMICASIGDIIFEENNGEWRAIARTQNIYEIQNYSHSVAKNGEEINGDSYLTFDGTYGKRYSVICDGMGSGENAKDASSICVSFLKEILSVISDTECALTMLSDILRARGLECSSTVDLMSFDLSTGKCSTIKCGASPTYIKRGDKVFKLQSKTMPLGILKELDAEESTFELMAKDVCIMVSDGVIDSKNDDKIIKIIRDFKGNIDTLPHKIIDEAKKMYGQGDDMTVCVILLEEK